MKCLQVVKSNITHNFLLTDTARLYKMRISAFLLCFLVGGSVASVAEGCDYSKCKDSNPFEDLNEVRFMPSAQQLRELCPNMLKFLECNLDAMQTCSGQTLNELAGSSNKSVSESTTAILAVGGLIQDLCNPHTFLHKDYVANIECFRGFILVGSMLCDLESGETLEDFYEKSSIVKGGTDDALNAEIQCLEVAYEVTCLSIRLGESCGEAARNAFVTVLRQLNPLLKAKCQSGSGPNSLKNKFLDYIKVDDSQMLKLRETLDLFRRRR